MKKIKTLLAAVAIALCGTAAAAQDIKLYAFSSGALNLPKTLLQNSIGGSTDPIQVPVGFFLIKHPKGTVLFDTGNNDKLIKDPTYWIPAQRAMVMTPSPTMTPDVAIDVQLAKVGVKVEDVKYVVASHMHLDHAGNIALFKNSTLLLQLDELRNAFWPEPNTAGPYVMTDFLALRNGPGTSNAAAYNIMELRGDFDIFGDGTVVIKKWTGHTPGSQMVVVKLQKTGTVVLTGDNVYLRENVAKDIPPNIVLAYDPAGIMRAYDFIRRLMASEKADFFTAHDADAFKAMKKAPDFYD
jgi:glyoxylase-like metal-dependent hydrolase (beta-lactamase superfamily II)